MCKLSKSLSVSKTILSIYLLSTLCFTRTLARYLNKEKLALIQRTFLMDELFYLACSEIIDGLIDSFISSSRESIPERM